MGKWTKYIRRYCVEWESDPRLKDWLRPLPGDPTKAYCRFCRAVLRAHHSDLLVHTGTRKHVRNTSIFLTSCKLKNVGDFANSSPDDGCDIHLCGKCGTRFNTLSSFIYHKVEEEGYRLFYAPSERNSSLILPNLLEDTNEAVTNNLSVFADSQAVGENQLDVTSVSITVASLPETFSDEERCYPDTDEDTNWEDHAADRDTNDNQETNEGASYSDESDKVRDFFACYFCEKLFDSPRRAQVHIATSHQAIIDGDGELIDNVEDSDIEGNLKETEADECEDDFVCSSCGAKFKKLSLLKSHQLTHSDIRVHACTYPNCSYSFKTKGSLDRHMRRHTGERPYVCNLCGRKFSESGVLARHLKSQIPCTMKSDAEFPRYGKPLKILAENKEQTQTSQIDITANGDDLMCDNGIGINSIPTEILTEDVTVEDRNFTSVKQNSNINDENLTHSNESSILVLPPSLSSTNQQSENKCSACHKSFENLEELKHHLILHLSSESFHCNVCDYLAKDEMDLIEHHNKQHSHYNIDNQDDAQLPPDEGIIIDREILENGSANIAGLSKVVEKQLAEIENISLKDTTNSLNETFTCGICKKVFKSGVYFRLHMKMHENSKRFQCVECKKTFQLKDGLRKHMTSHSKNKFIVCSICGKMYKTVSHAKEHMRAHSTDRPFVCPLCDKGFKSRNGLKVHVRTHTNDYPYSCNFCECRFREKPALVRHTRTHTGEKPFSCKHCGRSFAEHGTLNRHLRAKVPCTVQRKTKKNESDAVTSILSAYDNNYDNQANAIDMIQEVDVAALQNTSDSFPNMTSAEGQQYVIASGDDQEILSDSPQIDVTGTIPVSDFEGLNAGSYIIISQSDGGSEAVVAEFPVENVTFVSETEDGEDIVLNKEM